MTKNFATEKDKIIWFLQENGRASNRKVRSTLELSDEKYQTIKQELLYEGLIEKVTGQGGGIQLTPAGSRKKPQILATSSVANEKALYTPFCNILTSEALENGEDATVIDTSALRRRGMWSNPDVTKISLHTYPLQRTQKVVVTTYELKQWDRWNVDSVFEAASHRRFAHEAYVVLEWAKGENVVGIDDMLAVCSRYGVGLITLHPYFKSFRYYIQLEAEKYNPSEDDVEEYLGYIFEKNGGTRESYEALWDSQDQ